MSDLKGRFLYLTQLHQKILRYLIWMANKFKFTFPSLQHIARQCECSVATVQRALNRFRAHGWVGSIKRAYQSNIYFVADEIRSFDANSCLFPEECTSVDHVLDNPSKEKNIIEEKADPTPTGEISESSLEASKVEEQRDPSHPKVELLHDFALRSAKHRGFTLEITLTDIKQFVKKHTRRLVAEVLKAKFGQLGNRLIRNQAAFINSCLTKESRKCNMSGKTNPGVR